MRTIVKDKIARRQFLTRSAAAGAGLGLLVNTSLSGKAEDRKEGSTAFPKVKGLTKYVAEFIVNTKYSDIPADVIELGKKSILDGIGLALCGSVAETADIAEAYAKSLGCTQGKATVLGSSSRLTPRFAAFTNGVAIHVNDYDDTQLAVGKDRVYGLLVHPTVCVLPGVLALAELSTVSGRDLMLAYHVGVEVECKVAEAISPRHYEDGFHSTGTAGAFGSSAGCAKIRGFDREKTVYTLGIGGSQGAGLRENFGTMMKPFQAGHSAEIGVSASDLAGLGWTSAEDILEAPRGFFHAYGGGYDPGSIVDKLGRPWTFASPGVSIKPFPSGSLTHPGMTEMLRLIRKENIKAADVESVDVGTNSNMPNTLIHHQPTDSLQARFSMEFCMAILLLEGKAGLNQFTDEVVREPRVQEMIRRIHFGASAEAEAAGYNKMTTIIKIHLKDGRTIAGRADFGKGSPADPMTFEEVAEKFRDCATFAKWPARKNEAIIDAVRSLEQVKDVRAITALCHK